MPSTERRSSRHDRYDKSSKRPKRGLNANDIEKLKCRNFAIINTDDPSFNGQLTAIATKEDKSIQKHQTTRTLHKTIKISIPDFQVIRHELPSKSLNPSYQSVHHKPFKLPNHYIQYSSAPDRGFVSYDDYYDLSKDDIEWFIQQISSPSINTNDHHSIINETPKSRHSRHQIHNVSGQHLEDILRRKYQIEQHQYKLKVMQSIQKKKKQREKDNASKNQKATNNNNNSNNANRSSSSTPQSTNGNANGTGSGSVVDGSFESHNGHKKKTPKSRSPKKDKNSSRNGTPSSVQPHPFMMEPALGVSLNRAQSTGLNAPTPGPSESETPLLNYQSTRTPPPNQLAPMAPMTHNQSMFEFPNPQIMNHNDTMGISRDHSMSPSLPGFGEKMGFNDSNLFPFGNGNSSNNNGNGGSNTSGTALMSNMKNGSGRNAIDLSVDDSNSVFQSNVTLGGTRLTRLSLSKLMYFLDYTMYRRAKYKGDPERYFPLHDVLHAVKNWDATYDLIDVERVYMHWMKRRRQNGGIQEKALIRTFQEPPDTNDDDSNIAFRPRTSDERHVATRRQTKKPKKNTLDSYLRLKSLRDNLQKTCCYLRKLKEMEEMKKRMTLKAIEERQNRIIHSSQYIKSKAQSMDSMTTLDAKHSALFGTFTSPILQRESVRQWMGVKALTVDDLNSMSNHFKDVVTFRKKWENVCNKIAIVKTDGVVDAVKEQFGHFTPRYTDRVIHQLFPKELKPLQSENVMKLPKVREFELKENRPFHWELPPDSTNPMKVNLKKLNSKKKRDSIHCNKMNQDGNDDDDDEDSKMKEEGIGGDDNNDDDNDGDGDSVDEFMYDKERQIMEDLRKQRGNTVQQRIIDSIGGDTFTQYRYPGNGGDQKEKAKEMKLDLCPVAVPKISRDGALQIAVYHPMVETTDHVQYEPTRLAQTAQTDTVFDEFQIPMEPTIALYSARKGVSTQKSGIGRKRKHRAVSQSPPHLHSHNKLHLNCGLPPAPKRQKLLHKTSAHLNRSNAINVPSVIPLVPTASAPITNNNNTSNSNGKESGNTNGGPLSLKKVLSSNAISRGTSNQSASTSNGNGPITAKTLLAVGKKTKSAAAKANLSMQSSLSKLQHDKHRQQYLELQHNPKLRPSVPSNQSTGSTTTTSTTGSNAPSASSMSALSSLTALSAPKSKMPSAAAAASASASKAASKKRPSSYKLPVSVLNSTSDSDSTSTASKKRKKEKSKKKEKSSKREKSRDKKESKKKEKQKKKESKANKRRSTKSTASSSQKNTIGTYPGFGPNGGHKKDSSKSSRTGTKSKSATKGQKSSSGNNGNANASSSSGKNNGNPSSGGLSNGHSTLNGGDSTLHSKSNGHHSLQQQLPPFSTVPTSDATSTISNISSGTTCLPTGPLLTTVHKTGSVPPRSYSLPPSLPAVPSRPITLRSINPTMLHFPFDTLSMGNNRLPTPDGNTHHNPTPPQTSTMSTGRGGGIIGSLGAMPKFDLQLDMTKINFHIESSPAVGSSTVGTVGGVSVASGKANAVNVTTNNTPPTPPTNLLFNPTAVGLTGRPKKEVNARSMRMGIAVPTKKKTSTMNGVGTRSTATMRMTMDKRKASNVSNVQTVNVDPKQMQAMSTHTMPYPSSYASVPNVAPVVAMPSNVTASTLTNTNTNSSSPATTIPTSATGRSVPVSVPVAVGGNTIGTAHPNVNVNVHSQQTRHPSNVNVNVQSQTQSIPQQTQQTQQGQAMSSVAVNNAVNAPNAVNPQMTSMNVPTLPQLPQLPQQQSPTNPRSAPSYPVPQNTNPSSHAQSVQSVQSQSHRNSNPHSMHMMTSAVSTHPNVQAMNGQKASASMTSNLSSFNHHSSAPSAPSQGSHPNATPHLAQNYGRHPSQTQQQQHQAQVAQTQSSVQSQSTVSVQAPPPTSVSVQPGVPQQQQQSSHHQGQQGVRSPSKHQQHGLHPNQSHSVNVHQNQSHRGHQQRMNHQQRQQQQQQMQHQQQRQRAVQHNTMQQQKAQIRSQQQRMSQFATNNGRSSGVPLPPSAQASTMGYGGMSASTSNGRISHIPQFAATAPMHSASQMMSNSMHHSNHQAMNHQAMNYPKHYSERTMNGMHSSMRPKRMNGKPEIIEIDK